MSRSPDLEIIKAVRNTLLADSAVTAFVGTRVWDDVQSPVYPYLQISDEQIRGVQDSGEFFECNINVHVFTEEPGSTVNRKICSAVAAALDTTLTLDTFDCHETFHLDTVPNFEPEGKIHHRVVRMQYLVQPSE